MTPRHPLSHDEHGNLIGWVTLVDGTVESVEDLNAWADAFDADDSPITVAPPRPGRPSLGVGGESPRVTFRLPPEMLSRLDHAAGVAGRNRGDFVRLVVTNFLDGGVTSVSPPAPRKRAPRQPTASRADENKIAADSAKIRGRAGKTAARTTTRRAHAPAARVEDRDPAGGR